MHINPTILNALRNGNHPLVVVPAFTINSVILAQEEFERARNMVTRYTPGIRLETPIDAMTLGADALSRIMQIEQPHLVNLEQLAEKTVRELFNIPDYVKLTAQYMPMMTAGDSPLELGDDTPEIEISPARREYIDKLAKKRIILNGLAHGSAVHVWKTMQYLATDKVNEINPQLMSLYNKYSTAATVSTFLCNAAMYENSGAFAFSLLQGYNEIDFNVVDDNLKSSSSDKEDTSKAELNAYGITFPVLLHELNKAAVDYIFAIAIPRDLNEEELKYYYSKADVYGMEPWHYMLSTSLWVKLIEALGVESKELPSILRKLACLSYFSLNQLMTDLQNDVEVAKLTLKNLKK